MKITFNSSSRLPGPLDWKYVKENPGVYVYSKETSLTNPTGKFISFGHDFPEVLYIHNQTVCKAFKHWDQYTFYKLNESVTLEFN